MSNSKKNKKQKNIFITWHYTTHGIAYLKHVLSAYYKYGMEGIYKEKEISQEEMNRIFDSGSDGFVFDVVYYLTASQKTFDKLSLRRIDYIDNILTKDSKIYNDPNLKEIWEEIVKNRNKTYTDKKEFPSFNEEYQLVSKQFPEKEKNWLESLWRDIHHYTIKDQIYWFGEYSNAKDIYQNGKVFINNPLDIKNLRDSIEISKKVIPFISDLKNKYPDANFIINATLGSNETQVVWQVLSELNVLPVNTTLIQTYDDKEKRELRFKPFRIIKLPNKIVSTISSQIKLYDYAISETRKLAELKMEQYINSGFAILLLGERGIGKTHLAEKYQKKNQSFVSVNCASFTNTMIAESILFGYIKGAFTDAKENRKGVFEEANNGILFFDEIHHLDKITQAKLMKAIQTDKDNQFTIKKLGDNKEIKVTATLVFASNRTVDVLRKNLLPDFYDRIAQLFIELPPLRESRDDIPREFEKIWKQLRFEETYEFKNNVKNDNNLMNWLVTLDLYGNYRDLQKIAIYYKTYLDFNDEIKNKLKNINIKTSFDFAKEQFNRYASYKSDEESEPEFFSKEKTIEEMIDCFKSKLAKWAIEKFKGAPNAEKHFKAISKTKKGGKTTKETLYRWKNLCD